MNIFYFQIVIPTYEREKVLIESLVRYKDLPHLNKVSLLLIRIETCDGSIIYYDIAIITFINCHTQTGKDGDSVSFLGY